MLKIPDLLFAEPRIDVDLQQISELLEMAFLGRDTGDDLQVAVGEGVSDGGWRPEFFADDLFVRELVASCFPVVIDGKRYSTNQEFLVRLLANPPRERESVEFRQQIVRELEEDDEILSRVEALYASLHDLLNRLRLPGQVARLDINVYRLEVLKHCKEVIDAMVSDFGASRSGLHRLYEVGTEIQKSAEYELLAALVDYESRLATIRVGVDVGASGKITSVEVDEIRENERNMFYLGPWKRLVQRWSFLIRGYRWDSASVLSRLVHQVFLKLSPSLTPLVQVIGHLEFYLANRGFQAVATDAGLTVSLATFDEERPVAFDGIFNPLLLGQPSPAVACDVGDRDRGSVTLITGPNSGGKTRLLQAIGLAQLQGQGGVYVAARRANLRIVRGLFVSLIQQETADQSEGRLGRELMRIRTMFDGIEAPALVILDELCSGTNPSEGIEVFSLVLKLLDRLGPLAFISTHFLDYARELAEFPPIGGLEFLQVEVDEGQVSTYQFVPGVAATSLAAVMAKRLGVTYEELAETIDQRLGKKREAG